ncbi:MAG: hypothetical protein OEZ59_06875 [Deltaproteobacteria bacterium]|nr:hypothetical protein [Deltaproteobacteria bacterium]
MRTFCTKPHQPLNSARFLRAGGWAALVFLSVFSFSPAARGQFQGDLEIRQDFMEQENFLDIRSYSPQARERLASLEAPVAFRTSVGSLSMERFYVDHYLRLSLDLHDNAFFLYRQERLAIFRPEEIYQEAEFRYGRAWGVSITGYPSHDKRMVAQGAALSRGRHTDPSFLRLSHLKMFALFNDENNGPEHFERNPHLYRMEGRYFEKGELLLEIDARRETPTLLVSTDTGLRQYYSGGRFNLSADILAGDTVRAGVSLTGWSERREQRPALPSLDDPWLQQEMEFSHLELRSGFAPRSGHHVEAGVARGQFTNQITSRQPALGQAVYEHSLLTWLAYGIWEAPWQERLSIESMLVAGRVRRVDISPSSPKKIPRENTFEAKAALGPVYRQPGRWHMAFISTWDLDTSSGRKWDGGNARIQIAY